jgi:type VI secretion system protein ImpL
MRRLLGLVFNRWVAGTLLLLLLLAVTWIVGPLIAIADWHPLETVHARGVATGVLVVFALAWVGWRHWRARRGNRRVVEGLVHMPARAQAPAESADMKAVRERFEGALRTLQRARFAGPATQGFWSRLGAKLSARYLYELPWYLFIGAPGSGKTTALRNAGLEFPLAAEFGEQAVRGVGGTRDCDWWFTDKAVLIDTAGRFTTQDSDRAVDQATWAGFLALLKRSRPRQPLNGVLVTVAVPDLIGRSVEERARYAQAARLRLKELQEGLGLRPPVYLLVTKCDLLAGFAESFGRMGRDERATPWGVTFDRDGDRGWAEALRPALDALLQRLTDGLTDRLDAEADPTRRMRVYGFPNQFAQLLEPLQEFVRQAFAPSPYDPEPQLRGVYFVSGTQEGTPIDRVLGSIARRFQVEQAILPAQAGGGRSFFLQRLLTEVVFAEAGLAGTDRRWERRRSAIEIGGYTCIALLTVGAIAGWAMSWKHNRAYVDEVAKRVAEVRALVQQTPNRATADLRPILSALDATRRLADVREAGDEVPWSLGLGLYQGRKLDGAARQAYERMLREAVLPRLALRIETQLRTIEQPETQYEALKAYLMMYDPEHFDPGAIKRHVEADWDVQFGRELTGEQRESLGRHLDALLAMGPVVSPLPQDQALIDVSRTKLAAVPLPQRVYNRLRQSGLGEGFPEFTVVRAGGANAQLVFARKSGAPLTSGVPGLFTYDGYHKGFQPLVDDVTRQLADEQTWVLGVAPTEAKGAAEMLDAGRMVDEVRRLYLNDYRDRWRAFIDDIQLQPLASVAQSLEKARLLSAPDTPLVPLMKAISRQTTLLAGDGIGSSLEQGARKKLEDIRERVLGTLGAQPATRGTPGRRIESIVDDEFAGLRRFVTAPEGGQAPIEGVIERLRQLQELLTSVDAALKSGSAPPPSPLPTQLKVEAANAPEPVRGLLENLGSMSARVALLQLRDTLSRDVRAQVGEFCQQAVAGRFPFDPAATREVTPADFAALFGPGGKFEQMQNKLAPYIDTSTRPWSFRPVEGTPLGTDVGTLPQFQRAAVIRETFFPGGTGPSVTLEFKPVEMDARLREFLLDVDGQKVRYDHGPQVPVVVKWPGPRGSGIVRVAVQPAGSTGMLNDGPWALFRLFERVDLQPGSGPEKFRATFDIDGRKAVFDVTASSVRNPFRLPELRQFSCPNGL